MAQSLSTKGQVFGMDFYIATFLAMGILIIFLVYGMRLISPEEVILQELENDAKSISNFLVESGHPFDWDETTVIQIGLTNGNMRLQESKWNELISMTSTNYESTRDLLGSKNDFLIYFEDGNSSLLSIGDADQAGKSGITKDNLVEVEQSDNIYKVTRFVIWNSAIIRMVVIVW